MSHPEMAGSCVRMQWLLRGGRRREGRVKPKGIHLWREGVLVVSLATFLVIGLGKETRGNLRSWNHDGAQVQYTLGKIGQEVMSEQGKAAYQTAATGMVNSAAILTQSMPNVRLSAETLKKASDVAAKINKALAVQGVIGTSTTSGKPNVEIDINDLPQAEREILTLPATHARINRETGAELAVLGSFIPPGDSRALNRELRLRIRVSGETQRVLQLGETMFHTLFYDPHGLSFTWAPGGVMPYSQKVVLDIPNVPGFNLKHRTIGPAGSFIKHIEERIGCRVYMRGRGSGFVETSLGHELDEPMFIFCNGPNRDMVSQAAKLARNLVNSVKNDYAQWAKAMSTTPAHEEDEAPPLAFDPNNVPPGIILPPGFQPQGASNEAKDLEDTKDPQTSTLAKTT
ncbi:hypothetical protein AAMO2058_000305000 [Amorphochlora amoebiformis]